MNWIHKPETGEIGHTKYSVDYDVDRAKTARGAWFELARIAEKSTLTDEEIGQLVRELLKARPQSVIAFYRQ